MTRAFVATLLTLAGCYRAHEAEPALPELDAGMRPARDAATRDAFVRDAGSSLDFRPCERDVPDATCATTRVPRFWDDPAAGTVELTVERYQPHSGRVRRQMWLLNGGPGAASESLGYTILMFLSELPDTELLVVDHRGVGRSDRLACPAQEVDDSPWGAGIMGAEWEPCLASVRARYDDRDLRQFSTTSAARDVAALIERARHAGTPVFIYGISYGTSWAHRVMQVAPNATDGVVFDSIWSPGTPGIPLGYTRAHDQVGIAILRECGADPACSARIGGGDPVAWAAGVLAGLDAGACPLASAVGLDGYVARAFVGDLTRWLDLRNAIPAFFSRIERCAAEDELAFTTAVDAVRGTPFGVGERGDSDVLMAVVVRSEMLDEPTPTEAEYQAALREGLFSFPLEYFGLTLAGLEATPSYPRDEFMGAFAPPATHPILMMNGELDPQTPLDGARPLGMHFTGPRQLFVVFSRASHHVAYSTQYRPESAASCGLDVMREFMTEPLRDPDTSCRTETARFDFEDERGWIGMSALGTPTLWGGPGSGRAPVRGAAPRRADRRPFSPAAH